MQSSNQPNDNTNAGIVGYTKQEEGFDFKYLVAKVAGNWKWFALSLILTVGVGVLYLLYATPTFTVTARILVNGDNSKKISSGINETSILNELGLFSQQNDVNNEMQQLHSRTLIEQSIKDLQMNVSYWAQGEIRFAESYNRSPFIINLLDLKGGLENPLAWDVRIYGDSILFMDDFTPNKFWMKWGDTTTETDKDSRYCKFVLLKNPAISDSIFQKIKPNFPLGLKIASESATYYAISENLLTFLSAENTTTMDITLDYPMPTKAEDFVDHLIQLYAKTKINANNAVADSTMAFIDQRIDGVARDLSAAEGKVQNVLTSGNITDIHAMSQSLIEESNNATQKLQSTQDKIKAVDLVIRDLNDPSKTNTPLPTTTAIDDQTYISQVQKYNNLQTQRESQLQVTTENNPAIKTIDNQIALTRGILKNILATYKESLSYGATTAAEQNASVQTKVSKAPVQQRLYLEASRKQDVLQQLYIYLLTVREQTAVTKSNNIAPIRIIDRAQAGVYPYWPNKAIVIIACIFIGLVIPSAVILINELNSNKVTTPADIVSSTSAPLIAELSASKSSKPIVVSKETRTAVAEQFRTLRTAILSKFGDGANGKQGKVIMLTSTVSGEGKSFVTLNLATALSLVGKKVLVVDFELRKAQLSRDLGLQDHNIGIADYLEKNASLNDVILPSGVNENLWALLSGELEANPSEALLNSKMKTLFEDMRQRFDYIVVDTPPAAIVTDAQVIGAFADMTLYVVRQKYTYKKHVDVIEDFKLNGKLKNIYIILNDVKLVPGYNQGYGIGYRFDEDNGYYQQEDLADRKSLLQRIFPDNES
jgi:tyrosine-protein kinase Etk/Wzc